MNNISVEHSNEILNEMCRRVGEDVALIDFKDPQWYLKHEWSDEEQEEFRIWLGKFLEEKGYCKGKKRGMNMGYYEAGKLIMNYGWKVKDE